MVKQVITTENLSFSFGNSDILEDISLKVNQGDFMGIVGENGSGKSTLIKICLGLIKPQKGTVHLFDTNISQFKDWGKVGYIPQKATAFNQGFPATVQEIVMANLFSKVGLMGKITKENKEKVDEVLSIVGMQDYKQRLIGKLSGGQQQRVFIAKALVSEPQVILMDEPTVGIDSKSEESFYELMTYLNKEKKITLVMVTHDIGAISRQVSRIVCVSEGKLFEHQCGSCGNKGCQQNIVSDIYHNQSIVPMIHGH